MEKLETMSDFFTSRVEGYDEHMLSNVEGCSEGYTVMASLVPAGTRSLLDLGCGTGLELDEIFKLHPDLSVVGIDLTEAMLQKLREKHPHRDMRLICGDYFAVDFGKAAFDCAVSFETMHHFPKLSKLALYRRIWDSLKPGGMYIECDWMVETQAEEDRYFAENTRLRSELDIPEDEYCHFDTPCTIANQIALFKSAGFRSADKVFRLGGTTIVIARKA